jgi:uncharacterized protein (DUF885 family)
MKLKALVAAALLVNSSTAFAMDEQDLAKLRERILAKYPEKAAEITETCKEALENGALKPVEKVKDVDAVCSCWSKRTFEAQVDVTIDALRNKTPKSERDKILTKRMAEVNVSALSACNK